MRCWSTIVDHCCNLWCTVPPSPCRCCVASGLQKGCVLVACSSKAPSQKTLCRLTVSHMHAGQYPSSYVKKPTDWNKIESDVKVCAGRVLVSSVCLGGGGGGWG
jgi:hypothetical protein